MTASLRMLLSQATDLSTADVKTAFLNAHMKDGGVVSAKTATRVAAGNTGSEQRNSDLETAEKSLWPQKRTETLAEEVRLRPEHAGHLLVNPHDEASITRIPRRRLVVGWNAPDCLRNPH